MLLSARLTFVCLSRTSGLTGEQRGLGRQKIGTEVAHVKHHFQGQMVKDQLVADVLNSQHAGTGATWRINTNILLCRNSTATWRINAKILSTWMGAEAYSVATRTACLELILHRKCDDSLESGVVGYVKPLRLVNMQHSQQNHEYSATNYQILLG